MQNAIEDDKRKQPVQRKRNKKFPQQQKHSRTTHTHTHTAIEMGKAGKAIPKESKEEKSPLLLLML